MCMNETQISYVKTEKEIMIYKPKPQRAIKQILYMHLYIM